MFEAATRDDTQEQKDQEEKEEFLMRFDPDTGERIVDQGTPPSADPDTGKGIVDGEPPLMAEAPVMRFDPDTGERLELEGTETPVEAL